MFAGQLLLLGCVGLLSTWVDMPIISKVAIWACALIACGATIAFAANRRGAKAFALSVSWICTLLTPLGLVVSKPPHSTLDYYFVVVAWLIAAMLFSTSLSSTEKEFRRKWKAVSVTWFFWGSLVWLFLGYLVNDRESFFTGLAFCVCALVVGKLVFRMPAPAVLSVNTLILLAIIIPIADLFVRPSYRLTINPDEARKYYSYTEANKDPAAFRRWTAYFGEQWQILQKQMCAHDPSGFFPFLLRRGVQCHFFQSQISINSKGFRGKEISDDKGKTYRIVALGESTTFGITLRPEDRPWPEVLQQMIQERLQPSRPVEIINAGVPGWNIAHNLHRLSSDILPLKPDMIILYHGINGFGLLDNSVPLLVGKPPPKFEERPLKLLSQAEHNLELLRYRHAVFPSKAKNRPTVGDPMQSRYAQAYRDFIEAARTNGLRLVISTFSMAVNGKSEPEAIEFYRGGFPAIHVQIRANATHSMIVRNLVAEHPEVCFVDTQPSLDGEHEKFIDLMHLTQPGRQQVAEAFFAGIRKVLEQDLTSVGDLASPSDVPRR